MKTKQQPEVFRLPSAERAAAREIPVQVRRLAMRFGADIETVARRRLEYALRVFCAVYGFEFTDSTASNVTTLCYGRCKERCAHIRLAAGYSARPPTEAAGKPDLIQVGNIRFPRFHPAATGDTDWLGEIFEWISTADEQAISEHDSCGRIPTQDSLHGRYRLDPHIPFADVAMRELNREIVRGAGGGWPLRPRRPWTSPHHCAIVATHDVDFLPVSRMQTCKRLLKNAVIAALVYRDPRLAASILGAGWQGLSGRQNPLDCLPQLLDQERQKGIRSTYNVLCRQAHRRDANYTLPSGRVSNYLEQIQAAGMEIGLHGSYTSLASQGRLAEEYAVLTRDGHQALGGRQHWLRYRDTALFEELRASGAKYDCSVGFSEQLGFRAGAAFPYPPYDFATESAFPLIEFPLVLMDSAVFVDDQRREHWRPNCQRVLNAVRDYGWGGVSVLWHDTMFGGGQMPREIGELYWELQEDSDQWTSAQDLLQTIWSRYADNGLLPGTTPVP